MKLLILLATLLFLFSAFVGNLELSISNPFLAYLYFNIKTIAKFFPYFLITLCVIFLILVRPYLKRRHLTLKIIFHTIFQVLIVGFLGVFFSFAVLVFIAFIELNIFSIILNQNPKFLGVKTNTNDIINAIQNNNVPPVIITSDEGSQNEVVAIAKGASGTSNFYGNKILPSIPDLFILPLNNNSSLLFLDNTLVVKEVDERDMQILSPAVAYQIIKNYFPLRNIKNYPEVSVMTDKTYKTFRKSDAKEKLTKVDTELNKIENSITDLNSEIEVDNESIEQNEADQKDILTQRDKEYNSCLSEGSYVSKVFVPKNTEEFCHQIIDKWEDDYIYEVNEGKELSKNLKDKQKRLEDYRFFDTYFTAQKQLIDISSDNIPSELGLFEQPRSIKIIINDSSGTSIADYFNSLCHEYLHYASFLPGKRLESSFFEEGLTEYFAKKAIKDSLQAETNLGYPVHVKIIEELNKKISEPDLVEIYFTKDQQALEEKLNLVYGEDFYKNNVVLFESLQYTSEPDQVLEIVNRIMKNIGANPLKEEDIFSKESEI